MSVIAAALKHMLAANMPHEVILAAVEDMERGLQTDEQAERRRAADRDRQRERRLRISAESADKTDSPHGGVARVEDKLLPKKENKQEEQKDATSAKGVDLAAFKAELSPYLDAERLEAIIKHRRSKRGQLTALAARLFIEDAKACNLQLQEAVDACISRNWITVKPEYGLGKGRGPPSSKAPSLADVFELTGRMQNERTAEDFSGSRALVPHLSIAGQRRQ